MYLTQLGNVDIITNENLEEDNNNNSIVNDSINIEDEEIVDQKFNPIFTLSAMLSCFIYGLCFYRTNISFTKCLIARIFVNFMTFFEFLEKFPT